VFPVFRALELARQHELDLIEVAPSVVPPVCRIADFSKYKYEEEKKDRVSKKHQHQSRLKEIRLKPHIEEHDYQVKLKQLLKFLSKKDKVKVSMFFRGREMSHAELGRKILDRIMQDSANESQMEKPPLMEGRVISMVISPK